MSVPDNALKAPIRRPELPDDEPFLFELYASTRQDELELTRWDLASKQQGEVASLGYSPLPSKLVSLDLAALATVH